MTYYLFIIVCLAIHFVINIDIFRKKPTVNLPALKEYRIFVVSVFAYFLTDLLWGILYEVKLPIPLYVDTVLYFIAMGVTMLAWAKYVVSYLESKGIVKKIILYHIYYLPQNSLTNPLLQSCLVRISSLYSYSA